MGVSLFLTERKLRQFIQEASRVLEELVPDPAPAVWLLPMRCMTKANRKAGGFVALNVITG